MSQTLFNQPLNVINVGIAMFSDDLKKQNVPVTQLDWTPPGQGNMQVVAALDEIADSPLADKIAAANQQALERIIQSHPVLIGFDQAINVVPGMTRNTILHAGPPTRWQNMCGAMKGAVTGRWCLKDWRKTSMPPPSLPPPVKSSSRRATSTTASDRWRASRRPQCSCTLWKTKPTATAHIPI